MSNIANVFPSKYYSGQRIRVGGHKHTLVPIICSAISIRSEISLSNVPKIADTITLCEILQLGGARVEWSRNDLLLDCSRHRQTIVPDGLAQSIHGALYLVPSMLGQYGQVQLGRTGGCQIGSARADGARPISHIIAVLERFGANFDYDAARNGVLKATSDGLAPASIDVMDFSDRKDRLNGPFVSGATKAAVLAAICTRTEGLSMISNPYPKPDVTELLNFLDFMGLAVETRESSVKLVSARGLRLPKRKKRSFAVLSDLSEIITWITFAVMHDIELELEVKVSESVTAGLKTELDLLTRMGIDFDVRPSLWRIIPPRVVNSLDIEVTSDGIYSDHQPFFALMLLKGCRPARIRDLVWTNRFSYAAELQKLGAKIDIGEGEIVVYPSKLSSQRSSVVEATDLRSAAVLLIAASTIDRPVTVLGADHISRGYEGFFTSLRSLGANVLV